MRLTSFSVQGRVTWGEVRDARIVDLSQVTPWPTLLGMLHASGLEQARAAADKAQSIPLSQAQFLPPVLRPEKILCVGMNYPGRRPESGEQHVIKAVYPNLFFRHPSSLVGHGQNIVRPKVSRQLDYEGEVAIVIGKRGRHIPRDEAHLHILGLTLCNEGSVRDWLVHGSANNTQGKNFDACGSIGPWVVTADELDPMASIELITRVNGQVRQEDVTSRLMFDFRYLINYVSTIMTLQPGDILVTGTPLGTGGKMTPPQWLLPGDVVEIESPAIGILRNRVVDESSPHET